MEKYEESEDDIDFISFYRWSKNFYLSFSENQCVMERKQDQIRDQ